MKALRLIAINHCSSASRDKTLKDSLSNKDSLCKKTDLAFTFSSTLEISTLKQQSKLANISTDRRRLGLFTLPFKMKASCQDAWSKRLDSSWTPVLGRSSWTSSQKITKDSTCSISMISLPKLSRSKFSSSQSQDCMNSTGHCSSTTKWAVKTAAPASASTWRSLKRQPRDSESPSCDHWEAI